MTTKKPVAAPAARRPCPQPAVEGPALPVGGRALLYLRRGLLLAAMLAAFVTLAACGDDSDSDSGSDSDSSADSTTGADTAAAAEAVAPYTGEPTAFPVDEPLEKRPPAGTTIAYLQCATPFCAVFSQQLAPAAKEMGVELKVVKAGASAGDLQGAMDSIISLRPDAVIVPAVEDQIGTQLQELEEMGIPTAAGGVMDGEKHGIDIAFQDADVADEVGRALAGWAVQTKGDDTDVVFYTTPELSFSAVVKQGFEAEMESLCPDCPVRSADVPVAEIGNKAPARVVSDLQAHPDTNVAVFGSSEAAAGLPAQLQVAGLLDKVAVSGYGASPSNLQDIQAGKMAGSMAIDTTVMMWSMIDGLSRLITDQPITEGEEAGVAPMQLVEQQDLEGEEVEAGFVAYPDVAERFAELWSGGQ